MGKIVLSNDQLVMCNKLIYCIEISGCNRSFCAAIKAFRDYAECNPCETSLLAAFMKLLKEVFRSPMIKSFGAKLMLGWVLDKLLLNSEYAAVQLPMVRAYLATKHREEYCVAQINVARNIDVKLSGCHLFRFSKKLLAGMAVGQVAPCGHLCNRFVVNGGCVDLRVSWLHCYVVRTVDGFELYDCSVNGTSVVLK